METKPPWHGLAKRVENFRWNMTLEEISNFPEEFFMFLCDLQSENFAKWMRGQGWDTSEILKAVFIGVYDLIVKGDSQFEIFRFQENSLIFADAQQACLFTTLCIFLHASTRIKGKSLKDFIRDTSPMEYNNPASPNYRTPSLLTSDEEKFRRARHRHFSTREQLRQVENAQPSGTSAYYKHSQWSAMEKDAEHEWTFYHALNADAVLSAEVKDTFKRLGNLYKDILPALLSPKDDGYTARVDAAYKKFSSKLSKIQYARYLELLREIFRHLESNKAYYGINLYRIEKELRPFATTHYVNKLLACQNNANEMQSYVEEIRILNESIAMDKIWFPRLYEHFALLFNYEDMGLGAEVFLEFLNMVVGSACLVIDELVEKGCFGDDWESLFIQMTNDAAESVFYAPSEIDFTATDGSQKKFQELLDAPVRLRVSQEKKPKQGTQ